MKLAKALIGLLLLPACVGATLNLGYLLGELTGGTLQGLPLSLWGLVAGFALWVLIYAALPRPVRTYVWAHELTHALWGWLMGARIRGFKVSRQGGHVRLTHTNFLITLAPYFFPLYTLLVILLHVALSLFYDMSLYAPIWLGWVGLTWGFHLTFTLSMLQLEQPDIQEHGRLFSYTVIYLFNLLGICLWIVTVSAMPVNLWMEVLGPHVYAPYEWIWDRAVYLIDALYQRAGSG